MSDDPAEMSQSDLPDKCRSLRLRSIRKRLDAEQRSRGAKETAEAAEGAAAASSKKARRTRPAPLLSRYRRKTANARERRRMQEVNEAFDRLKSTIPHHRLFNLVSHEMHL